MLWSTCLFYTHISTKRLWLTPNLHDGIMKERSVGDLRHLLQNHWREDASLWWRTNFLGKGWHTHRMGCTHRGNTPQSVAEPTYIKARSKTLSKTKAKVIPNILGSIQLPEISFPTFFVEANIVAMGKIYLEYKWCMHIRVNKFKRFLWFNQRAQERRENGFQVQNRNPHPLSNHLKVIQSTTPFWRWISPWKVI